MSVKQQLRDRLIEHIFRGIRITPANEEEASKYERELNFYIINTLNLGKLHEAIHFLNPTLYEALSQFLVGTSEQNLDCYHRNAFDDSVVKSVFAFKMIVGE